MGPAAAENNASKKMAKSCGEGRAREMDEAYHSCLYIICPQKLDTPFVLNSKGTNDPLNLVIDLFDFNLRHAAEVDRAFAPVAGGARDMLVDHMASIIRPRSNVAG